MQQVTRRFRRFAAEVARTTTADAFDKLTQIGFAQYHRAGKRGRCWVTGICSGTPSRHCCTRHARRPEMEIEQSHIRGLCLREMAGDRIAAAFHRGWQIPPSTEAARQILDELTSVLSFYASGPLPTTPPTARPQNRD